MQLLSLKCLVLLCFVGLSAVPLYSAPRVVCPTSVFDFGVVADSTVVEHDFVLENQGDSMLAFLKVRACCGATAVLRDASVPAGSNTVLTVRVVLKGRKGRVDKAVYLVTNDPQKRHLAVRVTGTVERASVENSPSTVDDHQADPLGDIVVVPSKLIFMDSSEPVTRYVALRSRSGKPFTIRGVSLPAGATLKSQQRLGKAGWRVEIANLIPTPDLDGSQVSFITDHEHDSRLTIPVQVVPPEKSETDSP